MTKSAILVMMILRTIIMNAGEMKRRRDTVWKFYYFSITQNLREINFEDSRSAKSAVLGAVNLVHLVNFSLQKVQKFIKNQNSEPLNVLY